MDAYVKRHADFHRIAWQIGFLSSGRVADWIDQDLGVPEGEYPLLERLAAGEPEAEVMADALARLEAVPGDDVLPERIARDLLGRMGKKLGWDGSLGPRTAAMMARLAEVVDLPEEEVELKLFQMRYAFPAAREEDVTEALLAYLRPYESWIFAA